MTYLLLHFLLKAYISLGKVYKMVKMDKTKIQIGRDTWKSLNTMKRTGESFDDVIQRLIGQVKEAE